MKKQKLFSTIIILLVSIVMNCTSSGTNKIIKGSEITNKHIEQYRYKRVFILRFSNLIYEEDNKEIKIPIFQGDMGNGLYEDFMDYCLKNKLLEPGVMESGFIIKCNKGEVRKTFYEFLKFYKSNILKDVNIEKPSEMWLSTDDWIIKYDFIINNIPCFIEIELDPSDEDLYKNPVSEYKSVYEIIPEEDSEQPGIFYSIYIGYKSSDPLK